MQQAISIANYLVDMDEEDEEALELFKNIELQQSNSKEVNQHISEQQFDKSNQSNGSIPRLSRLLKNNKESKKQSKIKKIKEKHKHKHKKSKHHRMSELSGPHKKLKRQGSTKKRRNNSDSQANDANDQGSSQFQSESNNSDDLGQQLKNLNPQNASEEVASPRKRLKKSGRKQKIEEKEGFRIQQLGNQIERLSYESGSEFSNQKKKKQRNKKIKARVPTNEEIMNAFKEHGVVESEGEDQHGNQRQYDSGLDMLHSMKSKRTNGIRINNRLFGDLEQDLQYQQPEIVMPQNLALQLKPKNSVTSQRFSFLSKAETIKMQRGLEADVNKQQVQRLAMQRAKRSMAKVVSSMVSQNLHEDIDLQIRVPTITRGRSADLINNTVYLKNCLKRTESRSIEETQMQLKQTISQQVPSTYNKTTSQQKKDCGSRKQLFRQIQEQMRFRRSKYISEQELKNSFKKTNLAQLQEARKRIQQKKRKQMQSEQSENDQDMDSSFNEMIQKQQMICGDISNSQPENPQPQHEEQKPKQKQQKNQQKQELEYVQKEEPIKSHQQQVEKEHESQILNEQFEQFKQIAQDSDPQQQIQSERQEQDQQQQSQQQSSGNQQEEKNKIISPNQEEIKKNQQDQLLQNQIQMRKEVEMKCLEDEGIINLRRKVNKNQQQQQIEAINQEKYLLPNNDEPLPQYQQAEHHYQPQIQQNGEQFNNFKKLRKIAFVIAKKKKDRQLGRQYAAQFIEQEAEEGSDNEEHDDIIKNINDDDQNNEYAGLDLDADLVELIDNAVDINEQDQHEAFRKYLEDVRMQDREQIKKIIRGEFKRRNDDVELEMEQDERKRQQRMEEAMNWMKKREEQEGQNMYIKSPEQSERDSEEEDEDGYVKQRKTSVKVDEENAETDRISHEEEMARLQKFLEQTLPTSKREVKPIKQLTLFDLPQSVKFQKKNVSQKTISMSKLGSKNSNDINPQPMNRKNTSSLVNQILNKHNYRPKMIGSSIFSTQKKK